jgi:zinc protease
VPRLAFETFTLPNGLEVIVSQDRRLPLVAVNLWYHVGPANEEPGRTGFAHLFEHLMFQGSKHTPPDSHFSMLEAAGASDVNGTTDFDRTNYFETLPSNQIELALWIESDRMGYLLDRVDQASLSNQQDVVRNERRQSYENRPYGLADEALVQQLYPKGHPYHGDIIGSHEDIQAARLDDVKQFFKRYYSPSNASLAIVGDVDPAQVRALVTKYFGTLKRGPAVQPMSVTTPTITAERRRVIMDRVQFPRVYMAWLTPAIFKPGDADADITAGLLGGGRSSRLYKKLVYERQIAQDVSAFQQSLLLGSQFRITATARPGHTLEELEQAITEELDALRSSPPDASEVTRARNTIETELVQGLESLGGFGGVADRLNSYNHFLKTPDYLQQDVARYRATTPASVQAFVRDFLVPTGRVVVQVVPGAPQAAPVVPPQAPSAAALQGGEAVNADEPWRNQVPMAGVARPLQLPALESVQLDNGLTLMLNERKGLPIVSANLVFKTGGDANPLDRPGLASFTAAMVDEGTTTRGALQIADEIAQLGATLATSSTMDSSTVSTRALTSNFDAALTLVADVVLRPVFPEAEVVRQRQTRLGQLAQQRDNANTLTTRVVGAALYGENHPYGYVDLGTEASLTAIGREQLVAFWRQHYVPNNAALVVAGDISMRELRAAAERAFAAWPRGTPAPPRPGVAAAPVSRVVIVDRPGAPQTQLSVVTLGAPRSSPDFRSMQVMNMALGGNFSSRINMNLREEHGYAYGAYSQFIFRKLGGWFQAGGAVRTDATAAATREVLKEIRGMHETIPADELLRVKDTLSRSLAAAFETGADAAGSFSNIYIYDLGLDYYARYVASVNAVTSEQALGMARKYLPVDRLVVVAVGDRARIEPELRTLGLPVEIRDADGRVVN